MVHLEILVFKNSKINAPQDSQFDLRLKWRVDFQRFSKRDHFNNYLGAIFCKIKLMPCS